MTRSSYSLPGFRVSPEGEFCSFGSYHVFTDSPDGTQLLYVQWLSPPRSLSGGDAELWVCSADGTDRRKVIDLRNVPVHVGGGPAWIDDDLVQITNAWDGRRYGAAVVNVHTGKIVWGPITGASVQHEPKNGKVLLYVNDRNGDLPRGVHLLDCADGHVRQVCSHDYFSRWAGRMQCRTTDPDEWVISHPTWSPDGKRIAVVIDPDLGSGWWNYIASMDPDGSNPIFFGTKPIHWEWYDNNSLWGNDVNIPNGFPNDNSLRRWDMEGNWIENLAGGDLNHGTMSPDKTLFAGETWYDLSPVVLRLYDRGSVEPREVILEHSFPRVTWELSAHVDPSFSRDGKRLYYNKAVSDEINECWCSEIGM